MNVLSFVVEIISVEGSVMRMEWVVSWISSDSVEILAVLHWRGMSSGVSSLQWCSF